MSTVSGLSSSSYAAWQLLISDVSPEDESALVREDAPSPVASTEKVWELQDGDGQQIGSLRYSVENNIYYFLRTDESVQYIGRQEVIDFLQNTLQSGVTQAQNEIAEINAFEAGLSDAHWAFREREAFWRLVGQDMVSREAREKPSYTFVSRFTELEDDPIATYAKDVFEILKWASLAFPERNRYFYRDATGVISYASREYILGAMRELKECLEQGLDASSTRDNDSRRIEELQGEINKVESIWQGLSEEVQAARSQEERERLERQEPFLSGSIDDIVETPSEVATQEGAISTVSQTAASVNAAAQLVVTLTDQQTDQTVTSAESRVAQLTEIVADQPAVATPSVVSLAASSVVSLSTFESARRYVFELPERRESFGDWVKTIAKVVARALNIATLYLPTLNLWIFCKLYDCVNSPRV